MDESIFFDLSDFKYLDMKTENKMEHIGYIMMLFLTRALLIMLIWNHVIIVIFEINKIDYWQAASLIMLYNLFVWKTKYKKS